VFHDWGNTFRQDLLSIIDPRLCLPRAANGRQQLRGGDRHRAGEAGDEPGGARGRERHDRKVAELEPVGREGEFFEIRS